MDLLSGGLKVDTRTAASATTACSAPTRRCPAPGTTPQATRCTAASATTCSMGRPETWTRASRTTVKAPTLPRDRHHPHRVHRGLLDLSVAQNTATDMVEGPERAPQLTSVRHAPTAPSAYHATATPTGPQQRASTRHAPAGHWPQKSRRRLRGRDARWGPRWRVGRKPGCR